MKSFKSHILHEDNWLEYETITLQESVLSEAVSAKWVRSSFLNMVEGFILISDNIYKRLGDQAVSGEVFHTTSRKRFTDLAKIQKKRSKSISTRLKYSPGNAVWEAGYACKLRGDILFGAGYDISSIPDEQGRRWISAAHISDFTYSGKHDYDWFLSAHNKFMKRVTQQIKELFPRKIGVPGSDPKQTMLHINVHRLLDALTGRMVNSTNNTTSLVKTRDALLQSAGVDKDSGEVWDAIKSKAGKILQKAVADYIRLSHKILSRYVENFKASIGSVFNTSDAYESEFLLSNFTIEEVLIENYEYDNLGIILALKRHVQFINKHVPNAEVYWLDNGRYDVFALEELQEYFGEGFDLSGNDDIYQIEVFGGNVTLDYLGYGKEFTETSPMS